MINGFFDFTGYQYTSLFPPDFLETMRDSLAAYTKLTGCRSLTHTTVN